MQNVGVGRMLETIQQDAMMQCGHLECHYIGTCEMQPRAKCMELCQLL
jgi:hypothetical protein